MGGKASTVSTSEPRINGFQVQKSSYGIPIGLLLGGTNRVMPNLLYYTDFKAIAQTSTESSGGKGGGGVKQENTTYSYKASIILGLCEGPIEGVTSVLRDKSIFIDGVTSALAQAGLSLAVGNVGQSPWSYLTTYHPTEAIGYSQTAYVYAADYALTSGAQLSNHTFEVVSTVKVTGKADANPADMVEELLTNEDYGVPGWSPSLIGDLSDFYDYCMAANLLISPMLDQQRAAHEVLKEITDCGNSEIVWSEGLLKVIPYGTEEITGNGVTWTPNITPQYDLDDNDYLAGPDEDPVVADFDRSADAWNYVQVEFLNRARQYNTETATAWDQANIEEYGERKRDPVNLNFIGDEEVANNIAQLFVQRSCYVRTKYRFRLGWKYSRLEPMDYVTLTDTKLGLDRKLVRIIEITEEEDSGDGDEDSGFAMVAEEVIEGIASAPVYPSQGADGYIGDYNAPPGDVNDPLIFTPPSSLTEGRLELWAAVTGASANWGGCELWVSLDGTNYEREGAIYGGSRYGELADALPLVADPDTTSVLEVNLGASGGELLNASQTDVDSFVTLCWVNGEMIAYRDATLTAPYEYDLEYLRRGLYGTTIAAHAITAPFVRIDRSIFKRAFEAGQLGQTAYCKFLSFNIFGQNTQALSDVSPYLAVLSQPGATPEMVTGLTRSGDILEEAVILVWNEAARAEVYKIYVYTSDGATFLRSDSTASTTWTYNSTMILADGGHDDFKFYVVSSNASGDAQPASYSTITGPGTGAGGAQPAAVTGAFAYSFDFNIFEMTCDVSPDVDTVGYVLYMSSTTGFTPTGDPQSYSSTPTVFCGSSKGTRYGRIAAYNADWNGDPADLNFAAEQSAFVSDYREDSGCPAPDTLILMADGTSKRAIDLLIGDQVRTQHEITLEWGDFPVTHIETARSVRWEVCLEDGRRMVATPGHRVYVEARGWVTIETLAVGDIIAGLEPGTVSRARNLDSGGIMKISVYGARTYQTFGLLSHNVKP